MARPARPAGEAQLVAQAASELGVKGSARKRARAVAEQVAALALVHVRDLGDDPGPILRLAEAAFALPAIAALAADPDLDAAAMARAAAVREFEAAGCHWQEPRGRGEGDAAIVEAVAARLADRFRRGLK